MFYDVTLFVFKNEKINKNDSWFGMKMNRFANIIWFTLMTTSFWIIQYFNISIKKWNRESNVLDETSRKWKENKRRVKYTDRKFHFWFNPKSGSMKRNRKWIITKNIPIRNFRMPWFVFNAYLSSYWIVYCSWWFKRKL